MTAGNVSIRLSVQDAATVTAALEKLGHDGEAALKKIEAASSHPSAGLTAIDKTAADLRGRMEGLASSLGPVGTFFTALGPWGLAAAAAIGGVTLALYGMKSAADGLASRAQQIQNFADATGMTTLQVQALDNAGTKFSLTSETIEMAMGRLAQGLDQAHHGTGALFEDLYKVNPQLALQLSGVKSVAEAYDILGKAILRAQASGNVAQASALARAAFGRNAGEQGALAADVASGGGISTLAVAYQQAGAALDGGLLKKLRELETENTKIERQTKDVFSSMFAADVLARANAFDHILLSLAEHAKALHDSTKDAPSWFNKVLEGFNSFTLGGPLGGATVLAGRLLLDRKAKELADERRAAAERQGIYGPSDSASSADLKQKLTVNDIDSAVGLKVAAASEKVKASMEADLAVTRKWMAVLGAAATPVEQLTLKEKELAVALKEHAASPQIVARAKKEAEDAQTEAKTAAREQLGLASQQEILTVGLIKLEKDRRDGYITDAEKFAAAQRLKLDSEKSFKQEQVKNSPLPTLTKMGQGDTLADSFDKLSSGTLDKLGDTMLKIANNTGKASDNFREFGLQAVQAIEQTIIKATLLAPLAKMISGGMTGMFTGGGNGLPTFFAEGGIMTSHGPLSLRSYAGGGIANSPQLALFGEGSGPEAFVPLRGGAIPVSLNGGMRGGHTINSAVTIHYNAPAGASPEESQRQAKRFAATMRDTMTQIVDERIVRHLQSGGMLNQSR